MITLFIMLCIFIVTTGFALVFGCVALCSMIGTALSGVAIKKSSDYIRSRPKRLRKNRSSPEFAQYEICENVDGEWVRIDTAMNYENAYRMNKTYRKINPGKSYMMKKI